MGEAKSDRGVHEAIRSAMNTILEATREKPIDMILPCPKCGLLHVDAPDPKHDLYKDGDANIPDAIKDNNGHVVLDLCKRCGRGESELSEPCWTNPPHKSHLCHGCGAIWRPADVATNGVATIQTKGSKDTIDFTTQPARTE